MSDASEAMSAPPMPHYGILKGPNGLRAGWRLLIFVAIFVPLGYGMSRSVDALTRRMHADFSTPLGNVLLLDLLLLPLVIATWIMGRIERRTFADYGLPWRRAFGRQFWQGACFSFASFTVLLLVMRLAGVFSFGAIALHGWDVWRYAAAWAVLAFLSALLEDFLYRGYLLFTLTTGISFWPAAVVTSLLMGGVHYFNPSGHGLGPVSATMYCLVTVLVLRRTGTCGCRWESTRHGPGVRFTSTAYRTAVTGPTAICSLPAFMVTHCLLAAVLVPRLASSPSFC